MALEASQEGRTPRRPARRDVSPGGGRRAGGGMACRRRRSRRAASGFAWRSGRTSEYVVDPGGRDSLAMLTVSPGREGLPRRRPGRSAPRPRRPVRARSRSSRPRSLRRPILRLRRQTRRPDQRCCSGTAAVSSSITRGSRGADFSVHADDGRRRPRGPRRHAARDVARRLRPRPDAPHRSVGARRRRRGAA